jgi:predicted enzyme related to lactoylglutathione lyase
MRLAQVILFVKDMRRMVAFYGVAMGLRQFEGATEEGFVRFDAGGVALALHAIPEAIAEGIDITDPPRPRASTPIKLAFHSDDIDATRAHLEASGASIGDVRRFRDVGVCDGVDPEGNVFQITTR